MSNGQSGSLHAYSDGHVTDYIIVSNWHLLFTKCMSRPTNMKKHVLQKKIARADSPSKLDIFKKNSSGYCSHVPLLCIPLSKFTQSEDVAEGLSKQGLCTFCLLRG